MRDRLSALLLGPGKGFPIGVSPTFSHSRDWPGGQGGASSSRRVKGDARSKRRGVAATFGRSCGTSVGIVLLACFAICCPTIVHALDPRDIYAARAESVVVVGHAKNPHGTGSVVAPGRVLTNDHVVRGAEKIGVALLGENQNRDRGKIDHWRSAKVLARDPVLDLALLEVDLPRGVASIALADSNGVDIGAPAYAIGHPYPSGGLWSLTEGRIGARRRDFDNAPGRDVFQTDAAINPGNSGGPLLDEQGAMIGINTSKIALKDFEGLGFALQSNKACAWMQQHGVRGLDCPVTSEEIRLPQGRARFAQPRFLTEARASDGLRTAPRPLDREALFRSLREEHAEAFGDFAREQAEAFGEFDR